MKRPCHKRHPEPVTGCVLCHLFLTSPLHAHLWGGASTAGIVKHIARKSLPCIHEGPVIESCKTCAGEGRHVRACLHPNPSDPDRDTCTRVYVSGKVQACEKCPDRETAQGDDTARQATTASP